MEGNLIEFSPKTLKIATSKAPQRLITSTFIQIEMNVFKVTKFDFFLE